MVFDIEKYRRESRRWHMPPDLLRAWLGEVARGWSEDELYKADRQLYRSARRMLLLMRRQLRKERRKRRGR